MALVVYRELQVSSLNGNKINNKFKAKTQVSIIRTVRGSNPRRRDIFRTRPDRPCDTLSFQYNGYRFILEGKTTEA
jgi:hypothetical protein